VIREKKDSESEGGLVVDLGKIGYSYGAERGG